MPPANASAVSDPTALDLGDASSTESTGSLTSSAATDGVYSSSETGSGVVSAGVASMAPSGWRRSGGTNRIGLTFSSYWGTYSTTLDAQILCFRV